MPGTEIDNFPRKSSPVRVGFLHPPVPAGGRGPLSAFAAQRRELALDVYLYALMLRSAYGDDPVTASASQWARAVGSTADGAQISRAWDWLEDQGLVFTARAGRTRGVLALRDDGSGREWSHPRETREPYFNFPVAYWSSELPARLRLAGKAVLLIAHSLQNQGQPYFELPVERGSRWYGLSQRTVRLGLRQLNDAGAIRSWVEQRAAPNSPFGYAYDRRHSVNPISAASFAGDDDFVFE